MKNVANQYIQNMKPYRPPLQGRAAYSGVLLDFNERTIPVSTNVQNVLRKCIDNQGYARYPEYNGELEEKIITYLDEKNIYADNIMITNGGDQAIDVIFRTFSSVGDEVIIPSPSFAMFNQAAGMNGNTILEIPYEDDLSFPTQNILRSINEKTKLVTICSPNNPTGTLVSINDIEAIARAMVNGVVLVDEAYAEFSGVSAISLIQRYSNIVILRSFSKPFGLAGLRIGYCIADQIMIEEMLKVRGPYDVNTMAYVAAIAALDDWPATKQYIDEVMNEAKPLVEKFFSNNNIAWYPSSANFILFNPGNAQAVLAVMNESGFRMRRRSGVLVDGMIRVTIGTVKQMQEFISTYTELILNKSI